MKAEEGNKLIAEFMGIKTKVYSDTPTITQWDFNNSMLRENEMKYHTSWDWLKPVLKKLHGIYQLKSMSKNTLTDYHKDADNSWKPWSERHSQLFSASASFDIEIAFNCAVRLIQYYNNH